MSRYGRNIVRLRIDRTREMFAIHEELLCSRSKYFREKLQKGRKPIEGDFPICFEALDLTRSEVTGCRSTCGLNMHHACMKTWKEEKSARSEVMTCPACRQKWAEENEQTLLCPELDAKAFNYYNDWLYHRDILFDEEPPAHEYSGEIHAMIETYGLSCKVKDGKFNKAILQSLCELFQETGFYPGEDSVMLVYRFTSKVSPQKANCGHVRVASPV